jgi:hypothetical protein
MKALAFLLEKPTKIIVFEVFELTLFLQVFDQKKFFLR